MPQLESRYNPKVHGSGVMTNVRLPIEQREQLEACARNEERSLSDVVRAACALYLEQNPLPPAQG
jgi:predicted DNA-binding protein